MCDLTHVGGRALSESDLPTIGRAALILYSRVGEKIFILLGSGARGLTTLGGRTQSKELWMNCLVREVQEETRGLLDYTSCKRMFLSSPTRTIVSDNCAYVFYPVDMSVLTETVRQFPLTSSPRMVCNEMSSLEIVEIDYLIEELVRQSNTHEDVQIPCNPIFKEMFMNVGYDMLRGNTCNYITENISIEADLYCRIDELPSMVCLTPIDHNLPNIYGFSKTEILFITDQFYLERDGRRLFRSGWQE